MAGRGGACKEFLGVRGSRCSDSAVVRIVESAHETIPSRSFRCAGESFREQGGDGIP